MLKLELLALATKSCNFYPCQKCLSSCIIDQVCCSHGKSLIRKLHHWQKVKRSLLRVCKEESQERSGEDTVVKKWVLLSASQFRNSWKLPRCQPLSSHSYREQASYCSLLLPLPLEQLAEVRGLYKEVSAGGVQVSKNVQQVPFPWTEYKNQQQRLHFSEAPRF